MLSNPLLEAYEAANNSNSWESYKARIPLCKQFAWAIPNAEAIQALAKLGPIVEIGAGMGYWASLIAASDGDVIAYDIKPYENHWCGGSNYYHILKGGPEMAQKHSNRALLLCWPPYDEPMATDTLLAYEGNVVVYIGESEHGCTGDREFHELLDTLYTQEKGIDIPRWWGINDYLSIWRRK